MQPGLPQTSKVESFATIINNFYPLGIAEKLFILDTRKSLGLRRLFFTFMSYFKILAYWGQMIRYIFLPFLGLCKSGIQKPNLNKVKVK